MVRRRTASVAETSPSHKKSVLPTGRVGSTLTVKQPYSHRSSGMLSTFRRSMPAMAVGTRAIVPPEERRDAGADIRRASTLLAMAQYAQVAFLTVPSGR